MNPEITDTAAADDRDYGQLERRGGSLLLRFTRRLPHPPDKVWRALTEPEHLTAWFPTTIEGERAVGAHLRFSHRDMAAPPFNGEMLAFDPPSLLELRWGHEILRFALQPDGADTMLVFTTTFDELGKAARDGAGWHASLDLLGYEVGDQKAPWSGTVRWSEVRNTYIERFGPDAATIGPPEEWERVHGATTERRS